MKILKILVDKLPECCNDCWFHEYVEGCKTDHHFCVGNNGDNHDIPDPYDGRMNWCPLEEQIDNSCHCKKCDPNSYEFYYDDEDDEKA